MLVLTTGEQGPQASASRVEEQQRAADRLGATLYWGSFDDGAVPEGRPAIDLIQALIEETGAQTIYTHSPNDTHQDHRATALATMSAARRSLRVLRYESPTTTMFSPNLFVDVEAFLEAKIELICDHVSQVLKNGLVDVDAARAQARYHGFKARVHHAEAFETERFLWDLAGGTEAAGRLELDMRRPSELDVVGLR
jgi:LmbE family N-acetylglucosaminyl deacetylase